MNFITPYQREKEYKNRAAERLKDHQFTLLVDTDEVQIYRCSRPNTIVYSFDIVLAPNCIAISGDIGRVLYSVGRGLGFLANYGCSDYGFEKLDSAYSEKREVSAYLVADTFYRLIYEFLAFEEIESDEIPKAFKKPSEVESEELEEALEELRKALTSLHDTLDDSNLPKWLKGFEANDNTIRCFHDLIEALAGHSYEPDEQLLGQIIQDTGYSDFDYDWWDYSYTQPDSNVMWVTACAEYAAGRILERQKEAV
ncbi:hypothetical protein [Spartinivicinus ruber]|uniref:hypothetical protein n=1 Tax=Spartinivicinus ruber TaxID=2683272 RepID=UPI0013D47263|nr:hypothetical protein [Spartinivicinus ruber]